jgi:plasmid stability protein
LADLMVKGVPTKIVEVLENRAAANRRTLQQELLIILEEAAKPDIPRAVEAANQIREKLKAYGREFTDSSTTIGDDRKR